MNNSCIFYFFSPFFLFIYSYRKVSEVKKVCKKQVSKSCVSFTLQYCTQLMRSREYGCTVASSGVGLFASFQCCFEKPFLQYFFRYPEFFCMPSLHPLFKGLSNLNLYSFLCSLVCEVPPAPFLPSRASVVRACTRSTLDSPPVWGAQSRMSVPRVHRVKRVAVVES